MKFKEKGRIKIKLNICVDKIITGVVAPTMANNSF